MAYIKVFGPDMQEFSWSPDAHKRVIGDCVVIADLEKPSPEVIARKSKFWSYARWAFPGQHEEARGGISAMLDGLHDRGILSDGRYGELQEGLGGKEACREICALAAKYGSWARALKGYGNRLRATDGSEYNPDEDGLVWSDLSLMETLDDDLMSSSVKDQQKACNRYLDATLVKINETALCYAVRAIRAKKIGESSWQSESIYFTRIADGIEKEKIGDYMADLKAGALERMLR